MYVRERVEKAERGALRRRDVYSFAGFSLDFDPKLSGSDVGGIPIPGWYRSILYTRAALETLYSRFGLTALRREPTLRIETDPERGVFALCFAAPSGEIVLPVDTYALTEGTMVTLGARDGTHQARATVRLGGDGSVPVEVRVEGLGSPLDGVYAPAGGWHGRARQVFPTAADEIAAEGLAGVWNDPRGRNVTIAVDGAPPYRLRVGSETFSLDMDRAAPAADLLLVAANASGAAWGVSLRGPNSFVRTPLACSGEAAARVCHSSGEAEMLRRVGARVNAQ